MAEDWDLQAVVRSCSATKNTTTTTINNNSNSNPLSSFAALAIEKQEDPFCFPKLFETKSNNPFEELEQFYKPFFTTAINITTPQIIPTTSISDRGRFIDPQQHIQKQREQLLLQQQHLQKQHQMQFQKPRARSALSIGPRPRRRKNQQRRVVCQVTAESLSSDLWAWRKYGQKPIKGSPFPRNYYRCSSSKGCSARKQVEKSPTDPNMFIVTFTGDHTHPRPTHRNSLAGSTRNKFSTIHKPATSNDNPDQAPPPITNPCCSSSPPISSSSLSPTTPLSASIEEEVVHQNKIRDDEEMEAIDVDINGDDDENEEDDDENLLIPNMLMSEDIFMGFQELGRVPSPASPWAPISSATTTVTTAISGAGDGAD